MGWGGSTGGGEYSSEVGEAQGGSGRPDDEVAERRRRRPDLGDAATGLSGEGQGVGANRGDEGKLVDS